MSELKQVLKSEINSEGFKNAENLEYALQITKWMLKPLGLWPVTTTKFDAALRSCSITICSLLLGFLLIPQFLYVLLIEKDIKIRVKLIGPLSFTIMNVCKYFGILIKNSKLSACISGMAQDWKEIEKSEERNLMMKYTRTARYFTTVCVIFMYCGGLPFTTIVPAVKGTFVVDNMTFRHFAYPGYYVFFNPQARPNYEIVYFIHCICGLLTYTTTAALCGIAILCIMHICGQIAVTSSMLQNLVKEFDDKSMGKIVRKHIRSLKYCEKPPILGFATKLEDILTGMCLVEFLGCTFNICMLGYYFLTEYEDQETVAAIVYTLLLISFTFNIFIFCYIGDLLTEQCNSIGEVVYTIEWHELPANEARNLILIGATTCNPVMLTAGKMVTLSLRTFSNVLKVSLTYLNMLRTLMVNAS